MTLKNCKKKPKKQWAVNEPQFPCKDGGHDDQEQKEDDNKNDEDSSQCLGHHFQGFQKNEKEGNPAHIKS